MKSDHFKEAYIVFKAPVVFRNDEDLSPLMEELRRDIEGQIMYHSTMKYVIGDSTIELSSYEK